MREEQTEAEAVEAALERELDDSYASRLAFGGDDVEDDFKMIVEQHLQVTYHLSIGSTCRLPTTLYHLSRQHLQVTYHLSIGSTCRLPTTLV